MRETATVTALDIAMTGTSSDDNDDGQQDAQTRHWFDYATWAAGAGRRDNRGRHPSSARWWAG